jgi:2-dehydropantoate 2-reductase
MNIAIYGAGGVGGYYGGVLARAGHHISLIARGDHLAAIRAAGLSVHSPGGDFKVHPAAATDDPRDIGPVDAVIVSVKSMHLGAVCEGIAPLLGRDTLVVPLLNGVDAHEALVPAVGRGRMGKGLTRIISEVTAPGEIRHIGVDPYVAIAEWEGGGSPRVDALVAALRDAGVDAEVPADIDAAIWLKFLFVCSVGGVCGACRMPLGPVRTLPQSRDLLRRAMEEIAAVAAAHGVSLQDDAVRFALNTVDTFPAEGTSSLQRDIAAGRPSELDAWTGAAVRLGATVGVPTPVHSFIHAVLLPCELEARARVADGRSARPGIDLTRDGTMISESGGRRG